MLPGKGFRVAGLWGWLAVDEEDILVVDAAADTALAEVVGDEGRDEEPRELEHGPEGCDGEEDEVVGERARESRGPDGGGRVVGVVCGECFEEEEEEEDGGHEERQAGGGVGEAEGGGGRGQTP